MRDELVARWKADIVGEWQAELVGVDLLSLQPVAGRWTMALCPDGTAGWEREIPNQPERPSEPTPPFPITWKLSKDRVLTVLFPIPPMPEYGMPRWTKDGLHFDVLDVSSGSLALSQRRFDNEDIIVFRRMNREEYDRRKAAEYGRAMQPIKELAKRVKGRAQRDR